MEEVESEKFRDYQSSPNLVGTELKELDPELPLRHCSKLWQVDPDQQGNACIKGNLIDYILESLKVMVKGLFLIIRFYLYCLCPC